MPIPTSYSWAMTIQNAVPIGDAITMQTPGMTEPASYDTTNAEVVYGGEVLQPDEFTLTWATDFTSVVITNDSDEEWPVQDTIALAVAGVPFDPSALEETFTEMNARLAAVEVRSQTNEDNVADHEVRIAALETEVAGHAVRIAALEAVYIPVVTGALLYFPLASIGGDALCQMQATASPTGWVIVSELLNDAPSTDIWAIDASGNIYCNNPGGLAVNDMAVINVRASNVFGSGDGVCTIGVTA